MAGQKAGRGTQRQVEAEYPTAAAQDGLFVASLERALRVFAAFSQGQRNLGITEIAELSGLSKSAAQRFVHTWTALGYLERDPSLRRYAPGRRLLDLGFLYLERDHLAELAAPFLIAASERCQQRVNLSELDGHDLVYTFRVPARMMAYTSYIVGRRIPAFCSSGGRAVLAALPEAEARRFVETSDLRPLTPRTVTDVEAILAAVAQARQDGYALVNSEIMLGEIAVAAAVKDPRGRPLAAVHISVSSHEWSEAQVRERLAPLAMETARSISRPLARERR